MYAPRPASTTISAMVIGVLASQSPSSPQSGVPQPQAALSSPKSAIRNPHCLSSPPPRVNPAAENQSGNDQQRQPDDVRLLRRGQRDAAIVRFLGTDRNQVFLL